MKLFILVSANRGPRACLFLSLSLQTDLDPAGSSSVPEFFRVMTRQFTAHEWSVIQSAGSEVRQLAAFYRHWVGVATLLQERVAAL